MVVSLVVVSIIWPHDLFGKINHTFTSAVALWNFSDKGVLGVMICNQKVFVTVKVKYVSF